MRRRDAIGILAAGTAGAAEAGEALEVRVAGISPHTVRITVGAPGAAVPRDGAILESILAIPGRVLTRGVTVAGLTITRESAQLVFRVARGATLIQSLSLDPATGALTFLTNAPILGLGEGVLNSTGGGPSTR